VPPMVWFDEMRALVDTPDLANMPWFHPVMELLEPELLRRFQAQAWVWFLYTGDWPKGETCHDDVNLWWPVRLGRRRGQVPHGDEWTAATVDSSGVLHCGWCEARWSPNHDGSSHAARCKLCDRQYTGTQKDENNEWVRRYLATKGVNPGRNE